MDAIVKPIDASEGGKAAALADGFCIWVNMEDMGSSFLSRLWHGRRRDFGRRTETHCGAQSFIALQYCGSAATRKKQKSPVSRPGFSWKV